MPSKGNKPLTLQDIDRGQTVVFLMLLVSMALNAFLVIDTQHTLRQEIKQQCPGQERYELRDSLRPLKQDNRLIPQHKGKPQH